MRDRFSGLVFLAVSAIVSSACSMLVDTSGLAGGGANDGGASSTSFGSGAPGASGADAGTTEPDGGPSGPSPINSTSGGNPAPSDPDGAAPTPAPLPGDSGGASPTPDAGGGGGNPPPVDSGSPDTAPAPAPTGCSAGVARVFVTSSLYDGNFGGVSGADYDCAQSASAAGLSGNWLAWMSDSYTSAPSHIYAAPNGYVRLDGTVVASSFDALTSGSLLNPIDLTELKAPPTDGNTEVWTGIDLTGAMGSGYCTDRYGNDWSSGYSGASTPLVGHLDASDSTWTAAYLQYCNRTNVRVYCFEACP